MTDSANTTPAPAPHLNGRSTRKKPLRVTRVRRERMEAIVESLVRLLDELDGDADEEPSLGYVLPRYGLAGVDLEDDQDSGYGDLDGMNEGEVGEPSLGWTFNKRQEGRSWHWQAPWRAADDGEAGDDTGIGDTGGLDFDAEEDDPPEEHDHGEDNGDAEPEENDHNESEDDCGPTWSHPDDRKAADAALRQLGAKQWRPGRRVGRELVYLGEMTPDGVQLIGGDGGRGAF